jgi:CCR4-NOT transcription complex subunit 2
MSKDDEDDSARQELLSVFKKATKTNPTAENPLGERGNPENGLDGLMNTLRDSNRWEHLLAVGLDLEGFELPLSQPDPLILSYKSPFSKRDAADPSTTTLLDGSTLIPPCYVIPNIPPATSKVTCFSEDSLFYIFYSMPRDRLQELVARELTLNRGWRFWTTEKLWVTNDASGKVVVLKGDRMGFDTMWDVNTWGRVKTEISVPKTELEDRFTPTNTISK